MTTICDGCPYNVPAENPTYNNRCRLTNRQLHVYGGRYGTSDWCNLLEVRFKDGSVFRPFTKEHCD